MIHWQTWTTTSTRRNPSSGIPETKIRTTLAGSLEARITLTGKMGMKTLMETADRWNREGYVTSVWPTRCAADLGPAARRKFHTNQ